DLEVLDWATQLDNYLKHSFQVQWFGYSPRFDPGLMYGVILADQSKFKWAQWDDPKAIALLSESTGTGNEQRRKQIFAELHKMLQQQLPIIGLYNDPVVDATHPPCARLRPLAGRSRHHLGCLEARLTAADLIAQQLHLMFT
ncbi:MAG: hypothetical protein HY246_10625, partial [Proteobacteria bacterium]|nr:hypothetical protein [Pseudomonadota bacterium]